MGDGGGNTSAAAAADAAAASPCNIQAGMLLIPLGINAPGG